MFQTFIQRFVLFLGHPTYALTVVIFLLLVSSGAGSIASRWWLVGLPVGLVVGSIGAYLLATSVPQVTSDTGTPLGR